MENSPAPPSGDDYKAPGKELGNARDGPHPGLAVGRRAKGEAPIQEADRLLCES